jgi:hypothetical protein
MCHQLRRSTHCVTSCSSNEFVNDTTSNEFVNDTTNVCAVCLGNSPLINSSKNRCLSSCKQGELKSADGYRCVNTCYEGLLINSVGAQCVSEYDLKEFKNAGKTRCLSCGANLKMQAKQDVYHKINLMNAQCMSCSSCPVAINFADTVCVSLCFYFDF